MEVRTSFMQPSSNNGFTIPELLIVIAVSSLLLIMTFGPLNDIFTSSVSGIKSAIQANELQGALNIIRSEVSLAKSFRTGTDLTDTRGPNENVTTPGTWTADVTTNNNVLITQNFATTSSRSLVYANGPNCTNTSTVELTNNYIYFVRNSVLYRRTLSNPNSTCQGVTIAQRTSCQGSCSARDATLLTDVNNFEVKYYDQPTSSTALTSAAGIGNSRTIVVTLSSGSGSSVRTESVRITRINGDTL